MITDPRVRTSLFARLSRPTGGLALLAIDQRESLRTLLQRAGLPSADGDVTTFKVLVTEILSPHASGMLIDPLYGLDAVVSAGVRAPGCGMIVAVDRLIQVPGEPPSETELDESLDLASLLRAGAVALKFLVLWERGRARQQRLEMARSFVERCRDVGLLSVLEGVVRGPDDPIWDRDADVLAAAREFGALRPDLYKAEVPTLGRGEPAEIERAAAQITSVLPCPWVALSAGVQADRFPAAVEAVCRGGASGFLAGRGIWGPAIRGTDLRTSLGAEAVPRISGLIEIVDRAARPVTSA